MQGWNDLKGKLPETWQLHHQDLVRQINEFHKEHDWADGQGVVNYLLSKLPDEPVSLKVGDLCLAFYCSQSQKPALEFFESGFDELCSSCLAKMKLAPDQRQDVKSKVLEKLFVGGKITSYSGTGSLRSWLRAVIVREALSLVRKKVREVPSDEFVSSVADSDDDIAAMIGNRRIRSLLRETFQEVYRDIESRERVLLRYKFVDGLSIDDISTIYDIHRATAARWINQSIEGLHKQVRARLKRKLNVTNEEFEQLIGDLQSKLNFTIQWQLSRE